MKNNVVYETDVIIGSDDDYTNSIDGYPIRCVTNNRCWYMLFPIKCHLFIMKDICHDNDCFEYYYVPYSEYIEEKHGVESFDRQMAALENCSNVAMPDGQEITYSINTMYNSEPIRVNFEGIRGTGHNSYAMINATATTNYNSVRLDLDLSNATIERDIARNATYSSVNNRSGVSYYEPVYSLNLNNNR